MLEEDKYAIDAAVDLYDQYSSDDSPTNILQDNPIIRYIPSIQVNNFELNDSN